ncbi:MAG TPA: bifunctional diaminohydroxyphosphoribosylaminopyrimidine deaminase/5-amino-6-(5-phosphoribosylamino)uracil reductase RibD [Devosia sp.]|uniref:bifunctional diaminohydroxyphosphoribosylaminopyrimidine deaminase/5-amino-6-(5-phosphoribosylamino)uracil reductase RibD n=1 Tax=Devosia sp. TaxID=1871048 RepID=UPI002F93371E
MSDLPLQDRHWLDAAVRLATPFVGTTAENPTSAALVVELSSNTLISRAFTGRGGRPHAEALALAAAGFNAAGATLYTTIEPCQHWGRMPPCTDAIIRAGIMRVVIGVSDPRTGGSAIEHLESAGIEVVLAEHEGSAALHAGHTLRHIKQRPHTVVLVASEGGSTLESVDAYTGKIGGAVRVWHEALRSRYDALLVGGATARTNPDLTVALPGLSARTPLRVVLAGAAGLDRTVNLVGSFSGYRTAIIAETEAVIDAPVSVQVMRVPGEERQPNLAAAMAALAGRGVQNLLVEPGRRLHEGLMTLHLADEIFLLVGSPSEDGIKLTQQFASCGFAEIGRERIGANTLVRYGRSSAPV